MRASGGMRVHALGCVCACTHALCGGGCFRMRALRQGGGVGGGRWMQNRGRRPPFPPSRPSSSARRRDPHPDRFDVFVRHFLRGGGIGRRASDERTVAVHIVVVVRRRKIIFVRDQSFLNRSFNLHFPARTRRAHKCQERSRFKTSFVFVFVLVSVIFFVFVVVVVVSVPLVLRRRRGR